MIQKHLKNQACLESSLEPKKINKMTYKISQESQVEKLLKIINGVLKHILKQLMLLFQNLLHISLALNLRLKKHQPTIKLKTPTVKLKTCLASV